jgi:hypothetical protein
MVKLNEMKPGDIIKVLDEGGVEREGTVVEVSRDEKMACVDNGVQEFWYTMDQLEPLVLTEERLFQLGFDRQDTEVGTKYSRGPFRVLFKEPGRNDNLEIWYREDHRVFNHALYVHELQNHYMAMTKVPLERTITS